MATQQSRPNRSIVMAYEQVGGTHKDPVFESLNAVFVIEHAGDEPDWSEVQRQATQRFVFWDMIEVITPEAHAPTRDLTGWRGQAVGYSAMALQIPNPDRWPARTDDDGELVREYWL